MEIDMTWDEHLEWCKKRAYEYVERGELLNAVTSMSSDVTKHPDGPKEGSPTVALLMLAGALSAQHGDVREVRHWIDGWH